MVSVRAFLTSNWVRYGVVIFVAVGITVFSVAHGTRTIANPAAFCKQPGVICLTTGPFGMVGADKWLHGIAYALLTATLIYAFEGSLRTSRRTRLVLAVCLAVGFGICLEFVQGPIPHRTMSGLDAIADAIGACVLAAVWWTIRSVQSSDSEIVSG